MTDSPVRLRQARDVLRHPQPQPLHLDRVAFVDDVVVDARSADLREERAQVGCRCDAAANVVVAPADEPDMPIIRLHHG